MSGGLKDRASRGRGAVQFYSHSPGRSMVRPAAPFALRPHSLAETRAHYFRISSFFCSSFSPLLSLSLSPVSSNEMLSSFSGGRPVSLPASSFFTSPVGTEPLPRSHMMVPPSLVSAPSLQKPACILSALLIHHCHCFYPRKAADRPRQTPNLPIDAAADFQLQPRRRWLQTSPPPLPRSGGGLLAPHVTAKETPLRNISSSTPFSLPRRGVCENSLKMCEDFTVSPFLQGFVFFMR